MNLYDNLLQYSKMGYYPMHMPGHKRNGDLLQMENPYSFDITEIEGFDNLYHARGILLAGMEKAARLYGSRHTNYLIGSTSAGILTGISAAAKKGSKVLVARNCHKSVYHALYLRELLPVYLYPDIIEEFGINGSISPVQVEEMLIKHPDTTLVIITSPTYEGIVSDIKGIAKVAHKYGKPLMVDEAHGAHLGFHPGFPDNSVKCGADIVVHSIHKTLPAFTQSALIHVNGERIDYEEVKRFLAIYQSTSPSYLLMAGIDQCVSLLEERGDELFATFHSWLQNFYDKTADLRKLKVLTEMEVKKEGAFSFDPSKLTISTKDTDITGKGLYEILLNQYRIQMEMVSGNYVLGMTSIGDREEGFVRLLHALFEIDSQIKGINIKEENIKKIHRAEVVMPSFAAYEKKGEVIPLTKSQGRITLEYVYLYPPGIPLLVPGERISKELIEELFRYKELGLTIQGLKCETGEQISVAVM